MGRQLRLVLLLLLSIGVFQAAHSDGAQALNSIHDDVTKVTPKFESDNKLSLSTKAASTTHKPVSDEILKDLIEASKHSAALADDPRFNKMLPAKFKTENATDSKAHHSDLNTNNNNNNKSDEEYDDDYDYYGDYNDDDDDDENVADSVKESTASTEKMKKSKKIEMKPIKSEDKIAAKGKATKAPALHKNEIPGSVDNHETNHIVTGSEKIKTKPLNDDEGNDEDDDDDDYSDDIDDELNDDNANDDEDDDIADEEEIIFNENVPCPRYCVCARNVNSYLVATCSRIDPETQKFGSDITDLIVTDVGPKYPLYVGPQFFAKMGLKSVSSIKIANCTIQYLHAEAFHGLDELYSVNLTNVGLSYIDPNLFVNNKKLRMVTITGNDFSAMTTLPYLLKSSSVEELDLSRNNLRELNPSAFSQLPSIVYINLSQNNLENLPAKLFDTVETIEELDLSYNGLKSLPSGIFNKTALAILHLKYNSLTGDLSFGTSDIQQLDLSWNSITQIHHGMFDKMTGLTNLNLKANGIKKIQAESFLTLRNLRHIDLSINDLDQISRMVFYKNSDLDVIRLNDNPRLSQLPTDGFLSSNGYFTVYFLDISNCAIGALGHKTFSSMPHLATLKLAWNNINNLERDTFSGLRKLTELDLSNNLIIRLDDLIFAENNDLTKLNLAGNPIHKLSIRLFLPFSKLRELDVSDCELNSLFTDLQLGNVQKYKFFNTLRTFNASLNQIKKVSASDVKHFKNLHTLDITHNPLKCNEEFQEFISYVSLNTKMMPQNVPTLAELETDADMVALKPSASWAKLAHEVCSHKEMNSKAVSDIKDAKLEEQIKDYEKNLDIDAKGLFSIMRNNKIAKMHKILENTRKNDEEDLDELQDENEDEDEIENENESDYDDENDEDDDNDDDDDDDDDSVVNDDDEDDDEEDDEESDTDFVNAVKEKKEKKLQLPKVFDHGVKVQNIDLHEETTDEYLLKKFLMQEENKANESDEEIIIEHGRIYYNGYRFLVPLILLILCIVLSILVIWKVVYTLMRKRGERYRMALLASSNNSIVYQKLSEEIKPKEKECKQPKVHRYTPINQV